MFGFNCCRAATLTYVLPDPFSINVSRRYALRDDVIFNDWNNAFYTNPAPPNAYFGKYAYNLPSAPLLPDGSPNTLFSGLELELGMKQAVYSGSAEVPEFASGNFNGELAAYPLNYLTQKFSGIAQGTPIAQAQLILARDPHIPDPPIAINAVAKVWNTPGVGSVAFGSYPWSPLNSYGGAAPSVSGISFLSAHAFAVSGSPIVIDITADVQTIINKPTWNSTNCYITLLIYTAYPQPSFWINNIHPGGNYPNYPASNTAVWFSNYDPTLGAYVRIAL